ncbi:uncharacterized protein BKA78DRAFT_299774 [Phyllosticta capitalensis]|uniref:uncharacterized protein n=1 Tax=Phyllosticta capitalensis TaxID=121624 RepID=UPI00312FE9F6
MAKIRMWLSKAMTRIKNSLATKRNKRQSKTGTSTVDNIANDQTQGERIGSHRSLSTINALRDDSKTEQRPGTPSQTIDFPARPGLFQTKRSKNTSEQFKEVREEEVGIVPFPYRYSFAETSTVKSPTSPVSCRDRQFSIWRRGRTFPLPTTPQTTYSSHRRTSQTQQTRNHSVESFDGIALFRLFLILS